MFSPAPRASLRLIRSSRRAAAAALLVVSASALSVPVAAAATTTVTTDADAYVGLAAPTQNHGSSTRLVTRSPDAEFYMSFTIPTPPVGSPWSAATLVLRRSAAGPASTITVSRTTSAWSESSVTWQTRPTSSSATVSRSDSGTASALSIDVTSLLGSGTTGLVVRTSATTSSIFSSREAGATLAPTLALTPSSDTTIPPPPPSGCSTSARGIPCGVYVGATYGSNSDPTPFESAVGGPLGIRRTFWSSTQVSSAVNTVKTDLAKGRLSWLSFSVPYSWADMAAGKGDAWAKDIATKLAALNTPVWVAFHHEPEKDGDESQWVAMQRRLSPIVRGTAPKVGYTIILTGWHELYDPNYSLDRMWPGDGLVDVIGFDIYLWYGQIKNGSVYLKYDDLDSYYFAAIQAWTSKHNVKWGLAETGITDLASEKWPTWMSDQVKALKSRGAVAFTYFNTPLNNIGATWPITTANKTQQYAAALKLGVRM